jgi:uncharacterized protein involved in type VI secretion and phage assembly
MNAMNGVVSATVTNTHDPDGLGRVEIQYTWMEGQTKIFAPIATMMSGGKRGTWFMPEVNDEVLVAFYQGDPSHPYIVGFLWNGKDKPPSTDPQSRVIRSVNGHEIELYDPDVKHGDKGHIRVSDGHGNVIELSNARIDISSVGTVNIQGKHVFINRRRVVLAPGNI